MGACLCVCVCVSYVCFAAYGYLPLLLQAELHRPYVVYRCTNRMEKRCMRSLTFRCHYTNPPTLHHVRSDQPQSKREPSMGFRSELNLIAGLEKLGGGRRGQMPAILRSSSAPGTLYTLSKETFQRDEGLGVHVRGRLMQTNS